MSRIARQEEEGRPRVLGNAAWQDSGLQRMIRALRREGYAAEILVPIDTNRAVRAAERVLKPGNSLIRRLGQYAYDPPGRTTAPLTEACHVLGYRLLGMHFPWSERRNRVIDRNMARAIERERPLACIGSAFRCASALGAAKAVGTAGFLNLNANPWERNAALERMSRAEAEPDVAAEILGERRSVQEMRRVGAEVRRAHTVILQCAREREMLERMGADPSKFVVVPNGVDAEVFRPGPERDLSPRPLRALFAGHITYHKGIHYADEAVAKAGAESAAGLRAAGLATYGNRHLVPGLRTTTLLGQIQRGALIEEYQRADVFVFPTLTEAMARVVLEAMACGLPVIVTAESGYEGIIEDGVQGFIVPSFESETIAARLRLLAGDGDLRRRMGLAARATAERYPWALFERRFGDAFAARLRDCHTAVGQ